MVRLAITAFGRDVSPNRMTWICDVASVSHRGCDTFFVSRAIREMPWTVKSTIAAQPASVTLRIVNSARVALALVLGTLAGCSSGSNASSTPDASSDSSMPVSMDSSTPLDSSAADGPIDDSPIDGVADTGSPIDGATSDAGAPDVVEAAVGPSGQLDPSFGSGGIASTDFFGSTDIGNAMVVQGDGKIVVAGEAYRPTDGGGTYQVAVVRYDMHGALDPSFGKSGKYVVDDSVYGAARAVALQSTGSIVAAGVANQSTDGGRQFGAFLTRLSAAGALDASFGGGGTATWYVDGSSDMNVDGIAVAPDDSIVVVGDFDKTATPPADYDIFLARFNADGTPAAGFGTGGVLKIDLGTTYDRLSGVALRADGRILVGGQTLDSTVMLQFSAQGVPDATFGTSGRVDFTVLSRTDISAFGLDPASGAAYLAGDTVVAGDAGNVFVAMVQRFTAQGAVDMSFGTAGMVTVPFGASDVSFGAVLVDPAGGVICGGTYGATTMDGGVLDQWGLVRLDTHGALVPAFGSGGLSVSAFPLGIYDLTGLAWERDGTIVAAGAVDTATYEDFTVGDYFP
jgi:uncharacterized delta-60 repeat protein